jgi:hypothetical protein
MKFEIKKRYTAATIVTVGYKDGENKWLLAVQKAIDIKRVDGS